MSHIGILETTNNNRGYMHEPSPISKLFFQFARQTKGKFLDVGCASGVNSLPVLEAGASVVGFDMDQMHLSNLKQKAGKELGKRLEVVHGLFPDNFNFPENSFDAVLMSQVLGFISGPKIREGFHKVTKILKPEGKLFIINYTPFISITKNYIEEYEKRKEQGKLWPGHVEDLSKYCSDRALLENLPNTLNLMDNEILERELALSGLKVEFSEYLGGNMVPPIFQLDGKEWIGIVAKK
jgi:2-polyprenyl-3-methyl-5-hydroxy-6-metoxy-1,4-benzoquinol methylase